ncbi:hypothetical protein K2173_000524 [Erythroxylum novogranatense]|uniref:Ubiquitin carboxyl-terminal hydrolase 18-like n=1 Tax=Erythroxylum novogranatense TaxID=1862640 RepID=A0AAV8SWW9_9ROSI|nr:hypothetical protein K2173_000524 [Erythroxylum novogranatense]
MHVGGIKVDLNWLLQFVFTIFVIALGLLHLVKNTASKYFEVDAGFEGGGRGGGGANGGRAGGNADRSLAEGVVSMETAEDSCCSNCGKSGKNRKCSRCKSVKYCSSACQTEHWNSGHKTKCRQFGQKTRGVSAGNFSGVALVPSYGTSKPTKRPRKVLFPYEEFLKLYNSEKPCFAPCGLLNCGNSCFANVVLQCLTFTRPLVAYLLEKGHQREYNCDDWCFLCLLQEHVERASQSSQPFSPIKILSRLPNIGVCLDEFGGEKAVDASSQETTLIQHIFGGQLQSQVICASCNKISNQFESMMDLTVEIHGDAASLEECLDQFTVKEWLHGDNMYKCDGCNDYVKAWKRLTIRRAPNILTIALKRFQSGRFGKLNKRVTFPETLDLSPYMSEEADGTDIYKLYAVVVHIDMLNASFFGHYICYTKDFCGNWYRIDDCKVTMVELDEVLSQGAYMLLYSRVSARSSCCKTLETLKEKQEMVKSVSDSCIKENGGCMSALASMNSTSSSGSLASQSNSDVVREHFEDGGATNIPLISGNTEVSFPIKNGHLGVESEAEIGADRMDTFPSKSCSSPLKKPLIRDKSLLVGINCEDPESMVVDRESTSSVSAEPSGQQKNSCAAIDSRSVVESSGSLLDSGLSWDFVRDIKVNGSIHSPSGGATTTNETHNLKRESPLCVSDNYAQN